MWLLWQHAHRLQPAFQQYAAVGSINHSGALISPLPPNLSPPPLPATRSLATLASPEPLKLSIQPLIFAPVPPPPLLITPQPFYPSHSNVLPAPRKTPEPPPTATQAPKSHCPFPLLTIYNFPHSCDFPPAKLQGYIPLPWKLPLALPTLPP